MKHLKGLETWKKDKEFSVRNMQMSVCKTKVMRILWQPSTIPVGLQLENVEYFNYLCSLIINNARCTSEIKSITAMSEAAINKKKKKTFHQ